MLLREMPAQALARIMEITDQRLWRIVEYYVTQAIARFDLGRLVPSLGEMSLYRRDLV